MVAVEGEEAEVALNRSSRIRKVGIHIRYQRCETAWIALQLAEWLQANQIPVSVLSLGRRGDHVHPDWDHKVRSDNNVDNLLDWYKQHSHVVWFSDVAAADIYTAKQAGTKSILVASWDDPASHRKLYKMVDRLVSASPALTHRLRGDFKGKKVTYIPLHMHNMEQREAMAAIRPSRPHVLLNLRNSRKHQPGKRIAQMLRNWFHQIEAEWTIWVPRSLENENSWIHKCFVSPHENSSFTFCTKADWDSQRLLFGWHDVMVWPTLQVGFGLPVVMALTMGMPVASFDIPPVNEYVIRENSLLSPTQVQYNNTGGAQLLPDLSRFEAQVASLLSNPPLLQKYKKHTGDWVTERAKLFASGWRDVLLT